MSVSVDVWNWFPVKTRVDEELLKVLGSVLKLELKLKVSRELIGEKKLVCTNTGVRSNVDSRVVKDSLV